jgi:sec-independent protein translocase protein TatA
LGLPTERPGRMIAEVGPTEILIILFVVLLLFGSAKLPKLARSMGQASKEFRKGLNEGAHDDEDASGETAK